MEKNLNRHIARQWYKNTLWKEDGMWGTAYRQTSPRGKSAGQMNPYLMSMRLYACKWSWFRRIKGKRSTRTGSTPSCSNVERNLCLILSQQKGLHLTTRREFGTAHNILAQTCRTLGVIWKRKQEATLNILHFKIYNRQVQERNVHTFVLTDHT